MATLYLVDILPLLLLGGRTEHSKIASHRYWTLANVGGLKVFLLSTIPKAFAALQNKRVCYCFILDIPEPLTVGNMTTVVKRAQENNGVIIVGVSAVFGDSKNSNELRVISP